MSGEYPGGNILIPLLSLMDISVESLFNTVTFGRVFSLLYSADVRSRNHIQRLISWNKKRGLSGWHVVCVFVYVYLHAGVRVCVGGGGWGCRQCASGRLQYQPTPDGGRKIN